MIKARGGGELTDEELSRMFELLDEDESGNFFSPIYVFWVFLLVRQRGNDFITFGGGVEQEPWILENFWLV